MGLRRLHRLAVRAVPAAVVVLVLTEGCRVHYGAAFNPPRPILVAAEPPPAVPEEKPGAPYEGAVWIEGHHEWTAEGWVWLPGSYVRPRAGHRWVTPRYERVGPRVRYVPGYWEPAPAGEPPPPRPVPVPGGSASGGEAAAGSGPLEVDGEAVDPGDGLTITPIL